MHLNIVVKTANKDLNFKCYTRTIQNRGQQIEIRIMYTHILLNIRFIWNMLKPLNQMYYFFNLASLLSS